MGVLDRHFAKLLVGRAVFCAYAPIQPLRRTDGLVSEPYHSSAGTVSFADFLLLSRSSPVPSLLNPTHHTVVDRPALIAVPALPVTPLRRWRRHWCK